MFGYGYRRRQQAYEDEREDPEGERGVTGEEQKLGKTSKGSRGRY